MYICMTALNSVSKTFFLQARVYMGTYTPSCEYVHTYVYSWKTCTHTPIALHARTHTHNHIIYFYTFGKQRKHCP